MEKIRELIERPLVAAASGFVLGLIIGLFVLGWGLFPVQWKDAGPQQLREDLKVDYMKMAIQSYGVNPDGELAQSRWNEFGSEANSIFEEVTMDPGVNTDQAARFITAVQGSAVGLEPASTSVLPQEETVPAVSEEDTAAGISPIVLLLVFCLLTLVIGGALVYLLILRKRNVPAKSRQKEPLTSEDVAGYGKEAYVAEGSSAPITQFMTTYMLGDDLYDDSFSVDSHGGEFLGECGVGISDTIGVGEPKKVTAFEVWLFDKNDIQTITKVLMSEHAFNDPTISQRLASKGEPVLIRPGEKIKLETATLILEARIVDSTYGQGALPTNSYLERLTLELSVWDKKPA